MFISLHQQVLQNGTFLNVAYSRLSFLPSFIRFWLHFYYFLLVELGLLHFNLVGCLVGQCHILPRIPSPMRNKFQSTQIIPNWTPTAACQNVENAYHPIIIMVHDSMSSLCPSPLSTVSGSFNLQYLQCTIFTATCELLGMRNGYYFIAFGCLKRSPRKSMYMVNVCDSMMKIKSPLSFSPFLQANSSKY